MRTFFAKALLLLTLIVPTVAVAEPLAPDQVQQVEKLIREYLLKHPELLVEMSNRLRAQQEQATQQRVKQAAATRQKDLVADPNSYVAGNVSGDVTVVEFFDYQCGYCKRVHPTVNQLVQRDPNVRVVLKELPILGPASELAARAAIASLKQPGKYPALHNALMQNQGGLDENSVMAIAGRVGLDVARLATDMKSDHVTAVIAANRELAVALGIDGTPAFIIGDRLLPGAVPLDRLLDLVAQQRKK